MISIQDLHYLENLTKVKIPETELENYSKEISGILNYIQEIQNLEVGEYALDKQVHSNIFRDDITLNADNHIEKAIKNSPDHIGNLYKVSQVIKQ
jgi:aspartyl/glutamyl-tRNA(Asn/Gln) amidotransferase C subunit